MPNDSLKLTLTLDGDAPGFEDHRLSISAFGEPLKILLQAFRRIASGFASQAIDRPNYGRAGGKYAEVAKELDLELFEIKHGSSLQLGFACQLPTRKLENLELFGNQLLLRAANELLDGLESESRGELRNAGVRRFLKSLPEGIVQQRYDLSRNGSSLRSVQIGDVRLGELPADLPYLEKLEGTVVGVGFPPGQSEVRVKTADGTRNLAATLEQVDQALHLREEAVAALAVVRPSGARLLRIEAARDLKAPPSPEEATAYVVERWRDVLARLAQ